MKDIIFTQPKAEFYDAFAYENADIDYICIEYCRTKQPREIGECKGQSECVVCPFNDSHTQNIETNYMLYKIEKLGL
jgi:hypothetical protein